MPASKQTNKQTKNIWICIKLTTSLSVISPAGLFSTLLCFLFYYNCTTEVNIPCVYGIAIPLPKYGKGRLICSPHLIKYGYVCVGVIRSYFRRLQRSSAPHKLPLYKFISRVPEFSFQPRS